MGNNKLNSSLLDLEVFSLSRSPKMARQMVVTNACRQMSSEVLNPFSKIFILENLALNQNL